LFCAASGVLPNAAAYMLVPAQTPSLQRFSAAAAPANLPLTFSRNWKVIFSVALCCSWCAAP
jgi:hypothetical protein